jgi:hypothetical protein
MASAVSKAGRILKADRLSWTARFLMLILALAAILAVVEFAARRSVAKTKMMSDVVDIRTPATLAAKVKYLTEQKGLKIALLGDSLVAGQVMREHGDQAWRNHTLSADLQRRFNELGHRDARVMNFGMNGLLPADIETLVDAILPTKPDVIVIDVSLRSFSRDFAAANAQHSRDWLKPGMMFKPSGAVQMLPDQVGPSKAIERLLLNRWTTYRVRDHLRARYLDGEPKDKLQELRTEIERRQTGGVAGPASEMKLLLQVRSRYATASLDASNPQFAAWTRMLDKLKAANQSTIVFYATENPRLLSGLIDKERYDSLSGQLRQSVTSRGGAISYMGPNKALTDELYLDHVHVNAAGNKIYGESLFGEMTSKRNIRQRLATSLQLNYTPFIDSLNQTRVELGGLSDFTTSMTPEFTPEKPRFDLKGFPVLTVERRGPEMLRDITFLYNWWDKDGTPLGVRDSHHMLRGSLVPLKDYPEALRAVIAPVPDDYEYVDVFTGIPARIGAAQMAFFLQDSSMRSVSKAKKGSLSVYGQQIDRAPVASGAYTLARAQRPSEQAGFAPTIHDELSFNGAEGTELAGRGVRFELDDVAALFTVQLNHDVFEHKKAGTYHLGSMAPPVIGYRTRYHDQRTISFSGTDLIRFTYDPATQKLVVEAFDYDFRERTTRVSKLYPNTDGKRVHANLGFVSKLPPQKMRITHSNSGIMAFPLWQPGGALASFVVTEHADYVGVKQDTMTMFGSDKQQIVDGKGFLGNRIPLTKTIFPTGKPGPFQTRTGGSASVGPIQQSTLNTDDGFLKMLHGYAADGFDVEIGVHCVGTNEDQTQRKTRHVAEALDLMRQFKPITWVDHGGRDCLWETGWDPTSDHYVIPLLKQHNFKYINMLGDKYDGRYNMLSDNQPSNILFYSVGIDDDIGDAWKPIVFNTVPIGFRETDFTKEHLAKMVQARGLVNIHTYLPYEATMFETSADGLPVLKIHPWYNQLLQNIAEAARTGDLYLATARTLNDYMWKVRSLHVHSIGNAIVAGNPEKHSMPGLAIGYRAMPSDVIKTPPVVTLSGASISSTKSRDGTTYILHDMKP